MTDQELKDLIIGDTTAKQLARSGADDRCAERCREIAPAETTEFRATELTILSLYADPADAEAVLGQIETVANANSVVKRILKWLQPGAPGVDLGDARVRALLVAPVAQGGVGLTDERAKPLLDAATKKPNITGSMVAGLGLFRPQGA